MSNITNAAQTPPSRGEIIKVLRARNIQMGRELGTLRLITIILTLILVCMIIIVVGAGIKVRGLTLDLNECKEAYATVAELNSSLQEEIDSLKDKDDVPTEVTKPVEDIETTIPPTEVTVPPTEVPETTTPTVTEPPVEQTETELEKFKDVPLDSELKAYIYNKAIENDIPPEIMFALSWRETCYDTQAISEWNDYGLFQINEINFAYLASIYKCSIDEFYIKILDPYVNTECSIIFLTDFRDNYGTQNWHHVLMRYNLGAVGAQEQFDNGRFSTSYSRDIVKYAQETFGLSSIDIIQ